MALPDGGRRVPLSPDFVRSRGVPRAGGEASARRRQGREYLCVAGTSLLRCETYAWRLGVAQIEALRAPVRTTGNLLPAVPASRGREGNRSGLSAGRP